MIQTAVGIELTSSDLRIAVVRRVLNTYKLFHSSLIEGFSNLTPDQKSDALRLQAKKLSLKRHPIYLSLPRESGIIRQLELPSEAVRNLKAVVALQVETLSPWEIPEIYWDFAVERLAKPAPLVKVTIAIIPKETLDPLLELFKAVDLPLSGACLSPMAWVHGATLLRQSSPQPLIVVAGDPQHIHGILVRDGWLTSADLDGHESTRQSIGAVAERLLALAHIEAPKPLSCFCHEELAKGLKDQEGGEPTIPTEIQTLSGATTAALVGLKKGSFRSNLIPAEFRHGRSRLAIASACAAVGLCALLGLAILLRPGYQGMQYLRQLQDEINRLSPAMSEIARDEAQLNILNATYGAAARAIQDRDRNLEALRELAVALPPATWLLNYNYQDGSVTLSGLSENASQVEKVLESSPVFTGVQFVSPITREASGKERFIIRAAVQVR